MDERGVIEYVRQLYPEGCVVSMLVTKDDVKILSSELAQIGGSE